MVTIREIARECGVSIATVSNVLNGKSGVSRETREIVMKKVNELHYMPNSVAKNLKTRKTRTIGVIAEDVTIFSVPWVVDGITEYCEAHGYRILLVNLRLYQKRGDEYYYKTDYYDQVTEALGKMAADQVEAIIYLSAEERVLNCLPENFHIPLVMSYAYSGTKGVPSVLIDEVDSAFALVEHAIELGHRRIGLITGKGASPHTQQRLEGYRWALEQHGIAYDDAIIREGDWSRESGRRFTDELLAQNTTAIFCMNDLMAGGVYDRLAELGLRVGKDVSVMGYDDRVQSDFFNPPLTTVRLPLHDVGHCAAELALNMLEGKEQDAIPQETFVPCRIIVRDSVADIREQN